MPLDGRRRAARDPAGGAVTLTAADVGRRIGRRGVPVRLGAYTLTADGPAGRAVLTVFGPEHRGKPPLHYEPHPVARLRRGAAAAGDPGTVRVLGVDGDRGRRPRRRAAWSCRSAASGCGSGCAVCPPRAGRNRSSRSSSGTPPTGAARYPAGRFVPLVPERDGQYRLDFNRARNPFCAYSSAYPCPAPWRGNTIAAPVDGGRALRGRRPQVPSPGPRGRRRRGEASDCGLAWLASRSAASRLARGTLARRAGSRRRRAAVHARARRRRVRRWTGTPLQRPRVPAALGRRSSGATACVLEIADYDATIQARAHGRFLDRRVSQRGQPRAPGHPLPRDSRALAGHACTRLARRAGGTRRSSRISARARASSSCGTGRRDSRGR